MDGIKSTVNPNERLPWIQVRKGIPYFVTDEGQEWTPIGQNDAITWPDLQGAFGRKDPARVEAYFQMLVEHGITCIRLMLEYCQGEHRYLERPAGHFQENMVRLWDDIFALCEKYRLRILLTPYDTYWMRRRWNYHPYNQAKNGPCARRSQWLFCPGTRAAIKNRLAFATERWGGSGVLFAWDLWNEIRPAHGGNSVKYFSEFITDVSVFLREKEMKLHGRAHPQTVSFLATSLVRDHSVPGWAFRHPSLDFANIHFYEDQTIDSPRNTVNAAISTGRLTREALAEVNDGRPFFDSEHGPIHYFNNRHKMLAEPFDDEYFRHMQWAHFSSGGAGGGMRWPYRHPHVLTPGMRKAQRSLAGFLPFIHFKDFNRNNLNEEIVVSDKTIKAFGCGNQEQAIIWLLRTGTIDKKGMLKKDIEAKSCCVHIPGLKVGRYLVTAWNTVSGSVVNKRALNHMNEKTLCIPLPPIKTDLALAIVLFDQAGTWKQGVLF